MKKIILFLSLALILSGCAASDFSTDNANHEVAQHMAQAPEEAPSEEMPPANQLMGDKLIREVNLDVRTLDYEKDLESFLTEVKNVQGFMTNFNEEAYDQYKNYYGTARIPKDALDGFLEKMDSLYPKKTVSMNTQDVTGQYVDLEARLTNLKTREERLREMMSEATDTENLLMIDQELSNVTYEIERLTSDKNSLDERIDFATIYFSLYEDAGAKPVESGDFLSSLGRNFKQGFSSFFLGIQEFILFLASALPVIILIILILIGLRLWSKKTGRRLLPTKKETPPKDKE